MVLKVKDLKPNPYRRIENYPMRKAKVEALKNSIKQTSFWDNIVARKNADGDVEIAYGHHRLTALRELGVKTVDIPVKELDDATMLKIMANENMDDWDSDTRVINETICAVRAYLGINVNPETRRIGQVAEEIRTFLGDNWPLPRIKEALANLSEDVVKEAVEEFSTPAHASTFRREMKKPLYSGLFEKSEHKAIAKAVKEDLEKTEDGVTSSGIRSVLYSTIKERAKPEVAKKMEERRKAAPPAQKNDSYTIAHAVWWEAWKAVEHLRVRASDLEDADFQRLEKHFLGKIERMLKAFREE